MKIIRSPLCIAISGQSGCGNTSISSMLAEILGLEFINYTFRTLANEKNMSLAEICKLAETDPSWDKYVDEKQKNLSIKKSCVVGSRLAIWLLDHANIKFYLYADEKKRAQRIQMREGGTIEEQREQTRQRDQQDIVRYKNLYDIDITDYKTTADVIIDAQNQNKQATLDTIISELVSRNFIAHK